MKLVNIYAITLVLGMSLLGSSCIGDDFIDDYVEPVIRITNAIDTIGINTSYQFEGTAFDNVGMLDTDPITWTSSDPTVISINNTGLATGLTLGSVTISASTADASLSSSIDVDVGGETTVIATGKRRKGLVITTSSYVLEGNFELEEEDGTITLTLLDDYNATSALPGLYAYLSNNPNSISDAYEIGAVKIFEGFHSYTLANNIGLNDYSHLIYFCKPFNVKVGAGIIGDPE